MQAHSKPETKDYVKAMQHLKNILINHASYIQIIMPFMPVRTDKNLSLLCHILNMLQIQHLPMFAKYQNDTQIQCQCRCQASIPKACNALIVNHMHGSLHHSKSPGSWRTKSYQQQTNMVVPLVRDTGKGGEKARGREGGRGGGAQKEAKRGLSNPSSNAA